MYSIGFNMGRQLDELSVFFLRPAIYVTSLWSPYVIGQTIIFCPVISIYLLLLFSSPNLAVGDWMPTILLQKGVALVRI